jgi:NADPH2:quinone reductase
MVAIEVHQHGDETKLSLNTTANIPTLSPTECLVENHYAGLNFHDTYTRSGLYPLRMPFVVGCEGGGVVVKIGAGVEQVKVGDRVVYLQEGEQGSYAEYTNVEHTRLMPVPDHIDLDVATAAAVQGLTAHYLVHDSFALKKGDWCVIHAAAGGTGQILVQMAKAKGAHVIGTCSSKEKAAVADAKGCDHVILTKDDNGDDVWGSVATRIKQIISENSDEPIVASNYGPLNINDGAHCVYDGVGLASATSSLECLRPRGMAVFFGNASGAPPDVPPLMLSKLGSLSMTRPKMHDFIRTREEVVARSTDVFDMLHQKKVEFMIQNTIDFTRKGVVHGTKLLQERKTMGKILFDIKGGLASKQNAARSIMASRKVPSSQKMSNLNKEEIPNTMADAYLTQELVKTIILRDNSDTAQLGYKIAATSTMAQESVSTSIAAVTEPFFGGVFSHSTFESNSTISISDHTLGLQDKFLLIEPEFALRLKNDVELRSDHTFDSIKGHIDAIVPSVEIVTSAYSVNSFDDFKNLGAHSLVADNASHGGLVLGTKCSDAEENFRAALEGLDTQAVSLKVNGELVAHGSGDKVLGHPIHALCWLANELGKQGKSLRKGELVTTGVVVDALIVVKSGDTVSVDYGGGHPFGKVVFNFVD